MAHSQKNNKQASALLIANTDRRRTERSTSDSLGDVSWIQKAAFTRPSPALVLQATNAGARRSGYEANTHTHTHTHTPASRSYKATGLRMHTLSCSELTVPTRVYVR